jgi:hypothetical protein
MSKKKINLECRFKLEEAKYFYQQMEANSQKRRIFSYYLDAFLASSRSVTHVFLKQFKHNNEFMKYYDDKVHEWEKKKIMKFFMKMRNFSLKEQSPETKKKFSLGWSTKVNIPGKDVKKVVDSNGKEHWNSPLMPLPLTEEKFIDYCFVHDFKWFEENPEVMKLCKRYLDELEVFVSEVENILQIQRDMEE